MSARYRSPTLRAPSLNRRLAVSIRPPRNTPVLSRSSHISRRPLRSPISQRKASSRWRALLRASRAMTCSFCWLPSGPASTRSLTWPPPPPACARRVLGIRARAPSCPPQRELHGIGAAADIDLAGIPGRGGELLDTGQRRLLLLCLG